MYSAKSKSVWPRVAHVGVVGGIAISPPVNDLTAQFKLEVWPEMDLFYEFLEMIMQVSTAGLTFVHS